MSEEEPFAMSHRFALYFPATDALCELNGAGEAVAGAAAACDVPLGQFLPPHVLRTVSRQHFKIARVAEGSYTLQDLGSRNGTWLNGTPLVPAVPVFVQDGDLVTLAGHSAFPIEICAGDLHRTEPFDLPDEGTAPNSTGLLHRSAEGEFIVDGALMPHEALTALEYRLLDYLYESSGRLCGYDELARHVWDCQQKGSVQNNTIAKTVSNLRKKLDEFAPGSGRRHIQTVHGRGVKCVPVYQP